MSGIVLHFERCKGCLLCTTVCPEGLLAPSQDFNSKGYKVVQQEAGSEECKGCAFCAEICPDYAITVYKTKKAATETST